MLKKLAPLPLTIALAASLGFATPAFASTTGQSPAAAVATTAAPAPLLQPAELKTLLGQPGVRVLDIRA
ncbi:MAG TPA: sulfurtransferase, partial [Thauera aminoaromatica]|nr:sulfurtransferase [Thauera aminoaromatica]HND57972.1 sulfurtransferase [Thauera aminoaromatica]HNF00504.1 sulfurtransferase [Thauera aminoaromatica]HNF76611.1 sulfurtransferase [Thauera aminoaromatica]HNG64748.1 sulfurtransferase [Thauera aminoaromatica]